MTGRDGALRSNSAKHMGIVEVMTSSIGKWSLYVEAPEKKSCLNNSERTDLH